MKIAIALVIFCCLLSGCKKNPIALDGSNNSNTTTDEVIVPHSSNPVCQFLDDRTNQGTIFLGMAKKDVESKLNDLSIEITDVLEITNSPSDWDYEHLIYFAGTYRFIFDKGDVLYQVTSLEAGTLSGLQIGDSYNKVVGIFGEIYSHYNTERYDIFEYRFDEHYLRLFLKNDAICYWTLSLYPYSVYQ